jgi:uncharacterized Zn finger protein
LATRPQLTVRAVRDWSGDGEVRKGRPYADADTITGAVLQGDTLKASVQGTADKPYRTWARLAGGKVAAADCSCPVGGGGRCKHVAALLLRYVEEPDEFTEVEAIDANLQARDKAELIALIKQMFRRAPELESLLSVPLPGSKRKTPADPKVYRRQAAEVLREVPEYEEWGGDEAAEGIADIVAIGEGFEANDDWDGAAAVYQGVTAAVVNDGRDLLSSDYMYESDPTGRLLAGLLRCLDKLPEGEAKRESLMRSAFDLIRATRTDVPDPTGDPQDNRKDGLEALLARVTPEERRTLAGWARQGQPKGNDWSSRYERQWATELLLRIDEDVMDDDRYLAVCREAGMMRDLVAKLLELGRRQEAIAEVERMKTEPDYLSYCELLVGAGEAEAAERIVRSRPEWDRDYNALCWLIDRAKARRDAAQVLTLTERRFNLWPRLDDYREIRKLTPKAAWPKKREKLLRTLGRRQSWGLLIDVHLDEKEIVEALRVVREHRGTGRMEAVARAAEADHPSDAADLYRRLAEHEIENRSRGAYQQACKHLKKAGELMARTGAADEYRRYVAGLLEKHRLLRAFREEAEKAKLLPELPPTAVRRKPGR